MEFRLYCDSPYLVDWKAEVKSVEEKEGKFHVVLDKTAFYPGGGGQPSDRGAIDGIAVEDVYERDCTIYHVLGKAPQNSTVECLLDFGRRFDLMQQHTGQHLLSAVLFKLFNCKTSSLHMGEEELSIDVELQEMPHEMLTSVEDAANAYIYRDLPVTTFVVSPEEAAELTLRKTPPKEGAVRIVEIESIDRSPCCGTHVTRTGEIGMIKIVRTEKRGGETRLHFKCGGRALRDYRLKQDIVSGLVRLYRMSEGEVLPRTEAMAVQLRNTLKELSEIKDKLLAVEANELAIGARAANTNLIVREYEDKSFGDISTLAKYVIEKGNFIVIVSSLPEKRLLFAHGTMGIPCGKILKEHLASYNGKGGGKDNWANAGFADIEDLRRFEAFLKDKVAAK